jgi:MtN3 and saliva related transmembrane protein
MVPTSWPRRRRAEQRESAGQDYAVPNFVGTLSGRQVATALKLGLNMGDLSMSVGFIAGLVTTAANLPQVWKTYRNRSGEGLSFRMLLTLAIGLALWIIYGIMIKSLPLIATNAVVVLLILALIGMKLKFDRSPTKD